MLQMKIYICFFLLLIAAQSFAQQSVPQSERGIAALELDFNKEISEYYKKELNKISSIRSLVLKNMNSISSVYEIGNIQHFNYLEFRNSDQSSIRSILISLRGKTQIKQLCFRETHVEAIPWIIQDLNIEKITVKNCDGMKLNDFIKMISSNKYLRTLQIHDSQLLEFPSNNGPFASLRTLDLSNNQLGDISEGICNLRSLDTLKLNGNFIPNAVEEYRKLGKLTLDYLSIDPISPQDMVYIKSFLPGTHIEIIETEQEDQNSENNIKYGELSIANSNLQALSSAYAMYPSLLQNRIATFAFDSTGFEERFYNPNYHGNYSISELNASWSTFSPYYHRKIIRNKTSFNFYPKSKFFSSINNRRDQYYKSYPEFAVFKKMNWILDDTLSKKYFKKSFRKKQFCDIRLVFNSSANNFTFILKLDSTFMRVNAYPVTRQNKRGLESSQKQYTTLYAGYIKRLANRGQRFNKQLSKNKRKINAARRSYERMVWKQLRENYMSAEERSMKKEEWMKYYYEIIRNEEEALNNASVNIDLVARALKVRGFDTNPILLPDSVRPSALSFYIIDQQNNNLPIRKFILINKTRLSYRTIDKNIGFEAITLGLNATDDYAIIGILVDGSVSLTSSKEISDAFAKEGPVRLKSNLVSADLISIGQVVKEIEL